MGLTGLGRFLVNELIRRHLIIDMDHMSRQAVDDMRTNFLNKFEYPVIAGHTGPEMALLAKSRVERQISDTDLKYISLRNGLVGIGVNSGLASSLNQTGSVKNDCSNSTKTWAQLYLYAVKAMAESPPWNVK